MPTYIRVRDKETRHQFDVVEGHPWLAKGLVEPVLKPKYEPSVLSRPARHFVSLAGRSAEQEAPAAPAEGGANDITEE